LYEVEDGVWRLTKEVAKPKPVSEYTKIQGRFRHLSEDQIPLVQEFADRKAASYAKLMTG
jgi:pyruvate/2-oxoacid:ferredoxin oxidoreductase beta subunit